VHEAQSVSGRQIIGISKEHEAGVLAADLCRKHGFSLTGPSPRRAQMLAGD
jgi:hypothetical protein